MEQERHCGLGAPTSRPKDNQTYMKANPTQADIDELLAFLPVFSAPDYAPVRQWHGGPAGEQKSLAPFPEYDDAVRAFIKVAHKDCWTDRTYDPSEVSLMLEEARGIDQAGLSDLQRMLTFCVRGERFCDGHIGHMIESGRLVQILERLKEIADGQRPEEGSK